MYLQREKGFDCFVILTAATYILFVYRELYVLLYLFFLSIMYV